MTDGTTFETSAKKALQRMDWLALKLVVVSTRAELLSRMETPRLESGEIAANAPAENTTVPPGVTPDAESCPIGPRGSPSGHSASGSIRDRVAGPWPPFASPDPRFRTNLPPLSPSTSRILRTVLGCLSPPWTEERRRGKRRSEEDLIAKLRTLSPERLAEVEDFVDFLHEREAERRLADASTRLSEESFTEIWENPDDAEYDRL